MDNETVTIKVTSADRQICYERVVNTIMDHLMETDYDYWDDVESLKVIARKLDYKLR